MARPTRSSTTKRKPFGERSNDTALAPATKKVSKTKKKKTAKAKKKARRQSRQIGDDVIFYIQEKKTKAGKLYRAKVVAGGLTFMPANRKTPVAYDRHRHRLIEKTPEGDEIEVDLDCWEDKENIDRDDDEPIEVVSRTLEAPKRARTKDVSYADGMSTDGENEDGGQEEVPTPKTRTNKRGAKNLQKYDDEKMDDGDISRAREPPMRVYVDSSSDDEGYEAPPGRKRRNNKRGAKKLDSHNSDESVNEPPPPSTRSKPFSSPITKSNWEDAQTDWRCAGAMDY